MSNRIKNLINTWPAILLCYIVSHDKQMNKTKKLKNIKIREKVRHSWAIIEHDSETKFFQTTDTQILNLCVWKWF